MGGGLEEPYNLVVLMGFQILAFIYFLNRAINVRTVGL